MELCRKERDEYLEGWKRAKADLANFKKDETERAQRAAQMSNAAVIGDVVRVLDSFDLGIAAMGEGSAAARGMALIKTQLEDALRRHGLESLRAEKGEMFDPAKHEALGEIESALPEGAVVEEVERGYAVHGRVLRPVRVMIAKTKQPQ